MKILLIHAGGTIGMLPSEDGYRPKEGFLETLFDKIKDLSSEKMPSYTFLEMSPLLDSSDMTVAEWNRIGEVIANNYYDYDGFVVHPECWRDEFLNYDYIGSPWPLPKPGTKHCYHDIHGNLCRVGNSVSIRSKRLMDFPRQARTLRASSALPVCLR